MLRLSIQKPQSGLMYLIRSRPKIPSARSSARAIASAEFDARDLDIDYAEPDPNLRT